MDLFVNQRTNNVQLDPSFNQQVKLSAAYLSSQPLRIQYGADDPLTGIWTSKRLADPTGMIMGFKLVSQYDGAFVTSCSAFTAPADDNGFYTGLISFNVAALTTLLVDDGNPANDVASVTLQGEIDWKPDGNTLPSKSNPVQLTVNNAIVRGNEGATVPENPTFPAWQQIVVAMIAITGKTGGGASNLDGIITAGNVAPQVVVLPQVQPASWWNVPSPGVVSSSVANPSILQTSTPHGMTTGQTWTLGGHVGAVPDINGDHVVTVIDSTHFSIPVNVTTGGTGGFISPATNAGAGIVRPADFDAAANARTWQSFS